MSPISAAEVSINWAPLVPVGLVLAAAYFIACWRWPWTSCGHCDGGKKRSPSGKAWRHCRRCGGTGRKVRIGRKIWTYMSNTNEARK